MIISLVIVLIFVSYFIWQSGTSFDEELLNTDNIYNHIEELSSEKYFGKLTGATGNKLALNYIKKFFEEIGVKPAGVDNTYYQTFSTIVPDIDTNPIFNIKNSNDTIIKEFIMYEDYNAISSMNGGSIDFSGKIILAGSNLYRIDPLLIKDCILVIEANVLDSSKIEYVINNGGKGILCSTDVYSFGSFQQNKLEKVVNTAGKTGQSILVGYISKETYSYMLNYIGESIEERKSAPLSFILNSL